MVLRLGVARQGLPGLLLTVFLILCLGVSLLCFPTAAAAYHVLEEDFSAEPVASGVTLLKFVQETDQGPLKVYALHIDLGNPYVELETMVGADGETFTRAATVLEMARREGAVAAINGDFFHLKEGKHPLGFTVRAGELLTSPMLRNDFYAFALTKERCPAIEVFHFEGFVEAENGKRFPLSGINKPRYSVQENDGTEVSDRDRLQLYTPVWGPLSRGAAGDLPGWVEVVVENGRVREVRVDQPGVPIPEEGFVLAGHGEAARFLLENCPPGSAVSVSYEVTPLGEEIKTAVGGQALLVENGQRVAAFSQNIKGKFARSAVGFSKDGKQLYLVAVEGGSESRGMTQEELADFLVERLGVWRALNLDGGGSTSLVARPLGEEEPVLVNKPAQGSQRPVPDALGVFSTAPKGELAGLVIRGPAEVLAGLPYTYSVKGYDRYYNPCQVAEEEVTWWVRQGCGTFEGNTFRAEKGGTAVIEAECRGVRERFTVRVIGEEDLASLEVTPTEIKVNPGEEVALRVRVKGRDGRIWEVPADVVDWEVSAEFGQVQDGCFQAGSRDGRGEIRATFLGLQARIPLTVGIPLPPDVVGHWSQDLVRELLKNGVVQGYPDGSFRPEQQVTRAEFLTMLKNALQWTEAKDTALPFKDAIPAWARPAVAAAWEKGVASGYPDATFRPHNQITRVEMAVIVARALRLSSGCSQLSFDDAGQIPEWARQAVAQTAAAGIIKGYRGRFRPLDQVRRAEAAAVIYQVLLHKS
ncbi:MAG: Endoglucanase [Thermoanaerobacterales bacterium 50_218]|nr:MAG: Endoglucanase [Thermoanaerobacterales bacterium 50_218]HAA89147.1 hypothetical protein [Peptococcaceae bacterium]